MDKGSMDVLPEIWLPNRQNLVDTSVKEATAETDTTGMPAFQGLRLPELLGTGGRRHLGRESGEP